MGDIIGSIVCELVAIGFFALLYLGRNERGKDRLPGKVLAFALGIMMSMMPILVFSRGPVWGLILGVPLVIAGVIIIAAICQDFTKRKIILGFSFAGAAIFLFLNIKNGLPTVDFTAGVTGAFFRGFIGGSIGALLGSIVASIAHSLGKSSVDKESEDKGPMYNGIIYCKNEIGRSQVSVAEENILKNRGLLSS